MSKHNNNNNDNKKIVETTANENNEVNLDELLDQYDEEPTTEANTEETNVNETQEENNMDNNNTQVQAQNTQNTQAQETSKKEKAIAIFKGIGKYGTIVAAAGAAGWFGHKYLSKDTSDEPTAEQAFL